MNLKPLGNDGSIPSLGIHNRSDSSSDPPVQSSRHLQKIIKAM